MEMDTIVEAMHIIVTATHTVVIAMHTLVEAMATFDRYMLIGGLLCRRKALPSMTVLWKLENLFAFCRFRVYICVLIFQCMTNMYS
jgi:hypothetical protein